MGRSMGLNPFFFRSAFERNPLRECSDRPSLNPFFFRSAFEPLLAVDDLAELAS